MIATCFGSSKVKQDSDYYNEGVAIGDFLASKGYMIKNGGFDGLMEAVAKGASAVQGAKIIGVTNKEFVDKKPFQSNQYLTSVNQQNDIYDRLRELIFESDIFIVQYGGIGTLSELTLVWTLLYMNALPKRPKIFLIGNFWRNIIESIKILPVSNSDFDYLIICDDLDALKNNLD